MGRHLAGVVDMTENNHCYSRSILVLIARQMWVCLTRAFQLSVNWEIPQMLLSLSCLTH